VFNLPVLKSLRFITTDWAPPPSLPNVPDIYAAAELTCALMELMILIQPWLRLASILFCPKLHFIFHERAHCIAELSAPQCEKRNLYVRDLNKKGNPLILM
jgi:hypothetical protein